MKAKTKKSISDYYEAICLSINIIKAKIKKPISDYYEAICLSIFEIDFSPKFDKCGKPEKYSIITNEYKQKLRDINSEAELETYLKYIEIDHNNEEKRRKIVEDKAHAMLSQSSITAALLTACLTLFTNDKVHLGYFGKSIILFLFMLPILNTIMIGLLARKVVSAKYKYSSENIDFPVERDKLNFLKKRLIDNIFAKKQNTYLTNIKVTYLNWAHWLHKVNFISLFTCGLTISLIFVFFNNQEKNSDFIKQEQYIKDIQSLQSNLILLTNQNFDLNKKIKEINDNYKKQVNILNNTLNDLKNSNKEKNNSVIKSKKTDNKRSK